MSNHTRISWLACFAHDMGNENVIYSIFNAFSCMTGEGIYVLPQWRSPVIFEMVGAVLPSTDQHSIITFVGRLCASSLIENLCIQH
jgi:hypothetical protein